MINFKPWQILVISIFVRFSGGKTPDMVIVADFFKPLIDYVNALIWNQSTFKCFVSSTILAVKEISLYTF